MPVAEVRQEDKGRGRQGAREAGRPSLLSALKQKPPRGDQPLSPQAGCALCCPELRLGSDCQRAWEQQPGTRITSATFIYRSCCDKASRSGWLRATEIYYFTALEARSPKSRQLQGHVPSKTSRRKILPDLFPPLTAERVLGFWCHTSGLCRPLHLRLPVSSHHSLPVSVCVQMSPS